MKRFLSSSRKHMDFLTRENTTMAGIISIPVYLASQNPHLLYQPLILPQTSKHGFTQANVLPQWHHISLLLTTDISPAHANVEIEEIYRAVTRERGKSKMQMTVQKNRATQQAMDLGNAF